uniref:Reverse transcriptase domain-containing protein n=1 Tax=Amphimedon queenslandica TaxID=400682 RepID=A0A1X7VYP3_AMPQE
MVEGDLVAAQEAKRLLCSTFEKLGLPLEPSKLEGPSTCLTFLGIEVDKFNLQLRLPAEKLARLMDLLEETHGRKHILKKELESLTGLLQYAAKVVRPERPSFRSCTPLRRWGQLQITRFV